MEGTENQRALGHTFHPNRFYLATHGLANQTHQELISGHFNTLSPEPIHQNANILRFAFGEDHMPTKPGPNTLVCINTHASQVHTCIACLHADLFRLSGTCFVHFCFQWCDRNPQIVLQPFLYPSRQPVHCRVHMPEALVVERPSA